MKVPYTLCIKVGAEQVSTRWIMACYVTTYKSFAQLESGYMTS